MSSSNTFSRVAPCQVGFLMGKGGETITSIRERSGARMQLDPEDRFAADRPLRIVGTEEQVKTARLMVIELFKEHDPAAAGVLALSTRAMNSTDVISNLDQYRAVRREIPIPRSSVGRVIGRGGETIRRLQETSGARIQFSDGTVRMTPISLLPF
jgi:far upstream element-binding protein